MALRSSMQASLYVLCLSVLLTPAFGQRRSVEIPVTITGRVEIASGDPLPEPVPVKLACSTRSSPNTVSGELSLQGMSETDGLPMDKEVLSSVDGEFILHFYVLQIVQSNFNAALQQVNLMGCSLRARLPGFQSSTIYLGMRHRGDKTDVGTILLSQLEEGSRRRTVNLTSLEVPGDAREQYQKAREEMRKDRPNYSRAIKHLERALKIHPEYANAWSQLGRARSALDDDSGARQAYEKAISVDPEYLRPYLGLCRLELESNHWEKLAELSGYVLEKNPTIVGAQYYQALARFSLGDLEAAEKWALAVRQNSDSSVFPTTLFVLGAIRAQKGDIPGAAEQFQRYLEFEFDTSMAEQASRQLQRWEQQGLLSTP